MSAKVLHVAQYKEILASGYVSKYLFETLSVYYQCRFQRKQCGMLHPLIRRYGRSQIKMKVQCEVVYEMNMCVILQHGPSGHCLSCGVILWI